MKGYFALDKLVAKYIARNNMVHTDPLLLFKECRLCPRHCGANRLNQRKVTRSSFCGESSLLRVAHVGPHFGEEPPLTGKNGSGTVFFSGCSLKCTICQNYQISRDGLGKSMSVHDLYFMLDKMIRIDKVHNINLVTPDHFFPHVFRLVARLRRNEHDLPIIYNLSGYQSRDLLAWAEDSADIYLPDFKYANPLLSKHLSKCKDYPSVALDAIAEMVRQKGFLDASVNGTSLAKKGVLVRHMILPGEVQNSIDALTSLFLEFGSELPVSLMSQYYPAFPQQAKDLNRPLSQKEFDRVYTHALDLGLENLYVQFLNKSTLIQGHPSSFLPDFLQENPFSAQGPQD
jgi:putative pyruvate formate lyase activating enzyme